MDSLPSYMPPFSMSGSTLLVMEANARPDGLHSGSKYLTAIVSIRSRNRKRRCGHFEALAARAAAEEGEVVWEGHCETQRSVLINGSEGFYVLL